MSSLNPMPDESIYGFMFRMYLVNGLRKFERMLDTKGFFIFPPRVEPGTEYLFKTVKESEMFRLLETCHMYLHQGFQVSYLNHPFGIIEELRDFYNLNNMLDKSRVVFGNFPDRQRNIISVKVCLECIAESIKSNGFGYHKNLWLFYELCNLHNTPLTIINESTRGRTVKMLSKALEGNSDVENCSQWNISKLLAKGPRATISVRNHITPPDLFVMKCVLKKFMDELHVWRKEVNQENVREGTFSLVERKIGQSLHDFLHEVFKVDPSYFEKVFEKLGNKIKISDGLTQTGSLEKIAIKSNEISCCTCSYRDCLVNKDIVRFRRAQTILMRCEQSFSKLYTAMTCSNRYPEFCKLRSSSRRKALINSLSKTEKLMMINNQVDLNIECSLSTWVQSYPSRETEL